jgi:hypothetical protein
MSSDQQGWPPFLNADGTTGRYVNAFFDTGTKTVFAFPESKPAKFRTNRIALDVYLQNWPA